MNDDLEIYRERCRYSVQVGTTVTIAALGGASGADQQIADSRFQISFSPDPPADPPIAAVPSMSTVSFVVLFCILATVGATWIQRRSKSAFA